MGRFELHPYQQFVLDSVRPNKFIVWGRRFGKTLTLLRLIEEECRSRECLFISPNYSLSRLSVEMLNIQGRYGRHESIFYPTDGFPIHFFSYQGLDQQLWSIHPDLVPLIVLDEAELYRGEIKWLMARFRGNSRWAIAGTPHADEEMNSKHWFRRQYSEAWNDPNWDTFLPTEKPPHFSDKQIEQWKHELSPNAFATQILGQWLPDEA